MQTHTQIITMQNTSQKVPEMPTYFNSSIGRKISRMTKYIEIFSYFFQSVLEAFLEMSWHSVPMKKIYPENIWKLRYYEYKNTDTQKGMRHLQRPRDRKKKKEKKNYQSTFFDLTRRVKMLRSYWPVVATTDMPLPAPQQTKKPSKPRKQVETHTDIRVHPQGVLSR